MKFLIVLALASVSMGQFIAPYPYAAYPGQYVGAPVSSQTHAQDELGNYAYSYAGGPSTKTESKTNGITQGSYSYIDANGIQQTVNYVSDPVNGFRVAATNLPVQPAAAVPIAHAALPVAHHAPIVHPVAGPLPVDTPEVQQAKHAHFAAHAEARARNLA